MRPKHRDAVAVAGILQCTYLFSVRLLPFFMPLYPRPYIPSRDSVPGWYPAVNVSVFSSDVTFSGAPLPMPMRVPSTQRFRRWLVSCSARFLFLSSDVTFSRAPSFVFCIAFNRYFLLSTLLAVNPRISSYQRRLGLNCEVWTGWSVASYAVVVSDSSIFDSHPDLLMMSYLAIATSSCDRHRRLFKVG